MKLKHLNHIHSTVKQYITAEVCRDGLLRDVESVIPISLNDSYIDVPAVWIVQHPTVQYDKANLAHILTLKTTFEFVCIDYDSDLEIAVDKSQNLAARVGASVLKNFNKREFNPPKIDRLFKKIDFNTFYPVGEIQIKGKANKVPATGIVFDFIHDIDWIKCCKKR